MLTYHPAFDPYHASFRMLLLAERLRGSRLEVDRLRIYDFYLVFPREIKKVIFPRDSTLLKNAIRIHDNPYDAIHNPESVFDRMQPFQILGLRHLLAHDLIDSRRMEHGLISRTDLSVPESLWSTVRTRMKIQEQILSILEDVFQVMPLLGDNGLKYRTKLIEFKYDPI